MVCDPERPANSVLAGHAINVLVGLLHVRG